MHNTDLDNGYQKNSKKLKYNVEIGLTGSKIMHFITEAFNIEEIEAIFDTKISNRELKVICCN